jgi:hypothetical protein
MSAVLLLGGCAKPMEVGSITEIKPPPGTQGVDVYAAQRSSGQKVPEFAGDQIVEVRSFYANSEEQQQQETGEFAGAACKLTAANFSADLTTPAKVRVPVYRAQSSQLAVQCEKDGFKPKLTQVGAFNVTKDERLRAGSSAGAIGLLLMVAANAASDETTHDFKYPQVRVEMEKIKPASRVAAEAKAP